MRAFKGNTAPVGQVPIFVGTSYDTVLKVYERLDDIVRMGNLLEQTSDFLFFHFDVPWESLNQRTFTGPDKHGRTMAIIDQPMVYVNGERVPQEELMVLGEGTTLELANPVAPGDQVHIAAFGMNADGTLYFHPLLAIDRLLEILADIEILHDQMVGHVGAVTSLTDEHQASMEAYDLTLAAAKDLIDDQVIAVGNIFARAQSVWVNGGFELGDPSVKGIPYGWQGHGANLSALGTLAGSSTNVPADSSFKSTRSFGSTVSNLGPWWYISKLFKVSGGDRIVANYRYWSAGFIGSSPYSLEQGFLDSNDTFVEVVSYDADGAILETTRGISFSQKTWAGTGAKPLDQTWATTNHDPINLHPDAEYAEVRLVFANGTGTPTSLENYLTTGTAGNHGGLVDDVTFYSANGFSITEISPSVLGSAVHAKTAVINSQSSASFASLAEEQAIAAAEQAVLAQTSASNAGIIQGQVAQALSDAQSASSAASSSQILVAQASLEATEKSRGNYIGKATFEDGVLGNWGPVGGLQTVELVPEVHPLGRLKALSQPAPGYVWYTPSSGGGWYEENLKNRTFELDAWVFNDTLAVVEIGIEAIRASDGSTVYFWTEAVGSGLASWFHVQERLAQITVNTVKWRPYLRMLDVGECYWTDLVFRDITGLSTVEGVATAVATQVTTVQSYVDEAEGIATAMATTEASLIAQIDDVSASVTTQGSAIVDLQNGASAGYLVKAQAGGAVSLIQLVAASDGVTPPTSIVKIAADDIVLAGSVKADHMTVLGEIITKGIQVRNAIITNAHITNLDASKIIAGSVMSGDVVVSGRALADISAQDVMTDVMAAPDWIRVTGSGSTNYAGAAINVFTGTRSLRVFADGMCQMRSPSEIIYDPNKLYRVAFRVRRVSGSTGDLYLGLNLLDATKTSIGGLWVSANAVAQSSVPTTFTEYVGYIKGHAVASALNGRSITSPAVAINTTRFMRPQALFNYDLASGGSELMLDSVTISVMPEESAELVNAGTTQINPGKIVVSGATTLADWRRAGDLTRIDGGALSANTVSANKLTIGNRAITLTGIEFEHNKPVDNSVAWTSGSVRYIDDDGAIATASVTGGSAAWSSGVLYVYWVKGAGTLSATTAQGTAFGANNVVLATYQGGTLLDADYGRTVIDGSSIKTRTITATQLIDTAALITKDAQIENLVVDTIKLKDGAVSVFNVTGSATTATNNSTAFTTVDTFSLSMGTSAYAQAVIGIYSFTLSTTPNNYPSSFAVEVYIAGNLVAEITKDTLNANPNVRRYTVALSRPAIGAASFNVTAGIRNAGGYGLINTNLWAIAEKK